jgi:ATP-binding cassette subfamily F protein 3
MRETVMSIISARKIAISYGAHDVCAGISLELPAGGKAGLVGPNGVGKTSLLRVLANAAEPNAGSVHRARNARVGYLRQEAADAFVHRGHTLMREMETVFTHLQRQAEEMRIMEAQMSEGDHSEELLHEYGALQHAYESAGGYDYDVRIRKVLAGLGFPQDQWDAPVDQLSGGQQTRALLARLLLEAPDVLILDEPTNHLDVEAVEWLEGTLRTWQGAVIIASHDRYFLDRVVDTIWEMDVRHLDAYRGNYSAYLKQRTERWERNKLVFESEMELLWSALEVIERYFAWRKFEEAKGRLQLLGRDLVAIEHFGILGIQGKKWSQFGLSAPHLMTVGEARERIKAIRPPQAPPPPMHLKLEEGRRSGHEVLVTRGLRVGYEGKVLLQAGNLLLERGDRVALLGPNGAGKTSLLRTVLKEIPPVSGEIKEGVNVKLGYFAQAHDGLDPESSVYDQIMRHTTMAPGQARSYLARYLFRGDDVWKPIRGLSGGERARLALAIVALDGVNLLLLDEPTNHLDIPSQEVLQEALEGYDGTILMVSHDRYLVDRIATQVWEIRDGRLEVFKGSYAEYVAAREAQEAPVIDKKTSRPQQAGKREEGPEKLEREIAELEAKMRLLGQTLEKSIDDGAFVEAARALEERDATKEALEALLDKWASQVVA